MNRKHNMKKATSLRLAVVVALIGALMAMAGSALADTPVTVTVVDSAGTPQEGVLVEAFSGLTDTLLDGTTDPAGEATFVLADGIGYNFRATYGGTEYFSGGAAGVDTCTTPACTTDMVSVPIAPNVLPDSTCTLVGSTRTCDLWAKSGSITMADGATVPIWGYSDTAAGPAQLPGPMIIANEGETVVVNLTNQLPEDTALLFKGQQLIPDRVGAAASGGTASYSFVASQPGTFGYEAGLLTGAQYQVAMGLYGALIVRPTASGQAYTSSSSAFDDEALVVLGEIDPSLNNSASPDSFNMKNFSPRYFLINGKAFPDTDPIETQAGHRLLLRYVNAGIDYHSMALLGSHQALIALGGSPLAYSREFVAETFGPGQSADALVTMPAAIPTGSKLALHDGNLLLHNNNAPGIGGMLTFLTIVGPPPDGLDITGPVASNLAYAAGTVTATIDDTTTGGATILAAEVRLDSTAATPTAMVASDGTFDSVAEGVEAGVAVPAGSHFLYVRGQDALGNWGEYTSLVVNGGDSTGPVTKALTLSPNPTDGLVAVALSATGDDTATGGSNIFAAEYTVDGGTAVPMTVNLPSPIASLDAVISAGFLSGLSEGSHVVAVRSQDAVGNWGAPAEIVLAIDRTGPATSNVAVSPNPNNGSLPYTPSFPAVRVSAQADDSASTISAMEGFIDTVGVNGTGFVFSAFDGLLNEPSETAYSDIPLATIGQLSEGNHTIYVHARDAAGNWGSTASMILTIDKTGPVVSGVAVSPTPTNGAGAVTLSATATDSTSAIVQAEWFTGSDPGVGNGTAMAVVGSSLSVTVDVSAWADGNYTLMVRAKDAAGNWGAASGTVLVVSSPAPLLSLYFSTLGNTGIPGVGSGDDADIYGWDGSSFSRVTNANGGPGSNLGLPGNADIDGLHVIDANHWYVSFTGTVNPPGPLGNVQDEDIVEYDNGVWSLYFDGTALGLTGTGQDIDAFSIVGSVLYFSTVGNASIPGVGSPDDADIYSWDGSSFSRVTNANGGPGANLGLPGNADIDGLTVVDATHWYASFTGTVNPPGPLGNVQDEDIVYYDNGTWSLYFDGTAPGLTAGGEDLDAIHVVF